MNNLPDILSIWQETAVVNCRYIDFDLA